MKKAAKIISVMLFCTAVFVVVMLLLVAAIHRGYFDSARDKEFADALREKLQVNRALPAAQTGPAAWTDICWFTAYTPPEQFLPIWLELDAEQLVFEPKKSPVMPDHWGLVYYDAATRHATVYIVAQHRMALDTAGERNCFTREHAAFLLEKQMTPYPEILRIIDRRIQP